MSKYVDKMNLPQYRFYNHMVGDGERTGMIDAYSSFI